MKKLLSIMALFVISLLTVSMVSADSSTLGGLTDPTSEINVEVNGEEKVLTQMVNKFNFLPLKKEKN